MINIKAIIPLAGKGTRLRPHTYSKPKPLLHVAGKPVLGHILDSLKSLKVDEITFITGDMEDHIIDYVSKNYNFKTNYVKQKEMKGDGHAISLAKGQIDGDVIVVFVDTLFMKDVKKDLEDIGDAEGIVWTSKTNDPKRFGIVEVGSKNIIKGIEEKPENPKSDLALIGLYYFKDSKNLFFYLDKIIEKNINSKGEFRLADAIGLMIDDGKKIKADTVDVWLDCGKPETLIETNKYLLEHGRNKTTHAIHSVINQPVYIEDGVVIENSVVGPNVSIAKGSKIFNSILSNTIVGEDVIIENAILEQSLLGNKAEIIYPRKKLNVGDSTQIHVYQ